jgi:hypothetical protein
MAIYYKSVLQLDLIDKYYWKNDTHTICVFNICFCKFIDNCIVINLFKIRKVSSYIPKSNTCELQQKNLIPNSYIKHRVHGNELLKYFPQKLILAPSHENCHFRRAHNNQSEFEKDTATLVGWGLPLVSRSWCRGAYRH